MPGMLAAAHICMQGTDIEAAWRPLTSCVDAMYQRAGLKAEPTAGCKGCAKQLALLPISQPTRPY
mgnify:CR=1 FL=1